MSKTPREDAFKFLTPEHLKRFARAIHDTNNEYKGFLSEHARSTQYFSNRAFSQAQRNFFIANLTRVFTNVEGVKARERNGVVMLRFNDEFVLHFKKLNPPVGEENPIGTIPKTIQKAQADFARQPALFTLEGEDVPLGKLYDILGGHVIDEETNLIIGYYFNDQAGLTLLNGISLDLDTFVDEGEDVTTITPKTTFTSKKKKQDKDAADGQS